MPDTIRVTVELPGLSDDGVEILRTLASGDAQKILALRINNDALLIARNLGLVVKTSPLEGSVPHLTRLGRAVLAHYEGGG